MDIYTVSFFGHRDFLAHMQCEKHLSSIIKNLIHEKQYTDFLVGRNGEFDLFVSSVIRKIKNELWNNNSSHILILPYPTSEYINNEKLYNEYYDEVEICKSSSAAHYKSAIQIRNREMIDRSDLIIFYVEHEKGGAYQSMQYAKKLNKNIINLADIKQI